ncbi:MAG: LicD family protein [Bacillota bacterium]
MSGTKIDPQVVREAQLVMLRMLRQVDRICRENNISYWLDSGTLLGAVRHRGFIPWDDDVDICMLRDDYEKFLKIAPPILPQDMFLQNYRTDKFFRDNFTKIRDNNSLLISEEELEEPILFHQGIFIDIFPMDKLSTHKWVRYFWRRILIRRIYTCCSFIIKHRQRSIRKPFFYNLGRNIRVILTKTLFDKCTFPNKKVAAFIEGKLRRFSTIQSENKGRFVLGYGYSTVFTETYSYDVIFPLRELTFEGVQFYVPNDYDQYLRNLYGDTYMQLPKEENRRQHAVRIIPALNKDVKFSI